MEAIAKQFERMGARFKFMDRGENGINVLKDKNGEFFSYRGDMKLAVVDVQPAQRHLLLHMQDGDKKGKFLCGHDERAWFVASVPGRGVTNVRTAMEALKPAAVRQIQAEKRARVEGRRRRRNEAYVRQGEWFFTPADISPDPKLIRRYEPIRRGSGKPHMCEFLYRTNGETVYVSHNHPNGISEGEYKDLSLKERRSQNWQIMSRDARTYVKGRITHSDHATIELKTWHRVMPNRESEAALTFVRFLRFLD